MPHTGPSLRCFLLFCFFFLLFRAVLAAYEVPRLEIQATSGTYTTAHSSAGSLTH